MEKAGVVLNFYCKILQLKLKPDFSNNHQKNKDDSSF